MSVRRQATALFLLIGAAAVMVSACSSSGGESKSSGTASSAGTSAAKSGGVAPTGKKVEVKVSMKDNFFEPKEISVNAGDTIEFEAKNDGIAIHNMMIQSSAAEGKDFSSAAAVNPGDESKFTVTFTKPGTHKFICAYHLPDMVGTITVK